MIIGWYPAMANKKDTDHTKIPSKARSAPVYRVFSWSYFLTHSAEI